MPPKIPAEFYCPISGEIMQEPIITSCEHNFEAAALSTWIYASGDAKCPCCNAALGQQEFKLNHELQAQISQFKHLYPDCVANQSQATQLLILQAKQRGMLLQQQMILQQLAVSNLQEQIAQPPAAVPWQRVNYTVSRSKYNGNS